MINNMPNNGDHLSDDLLSERLDATVDAPMRARLDAHLATCAECATRFAGLQAVRATLHAMQQVASVPDFRLTPQGQSRRAVPRRTMPPVFGRVSMARFASAAVTLCGMFLIALSLSGSLAHYAQSNSSAGSSFAGATQGHCTTVHCPSNSFIGSPSPTSQFGAMQPTAGPYKTVTPTPTEGVINSTSASTPTPSAPSSSSFLSFLSPIELVVGIILTLSGLLTLATVRRQ